MLISLCKYLSYLVTFSTVASLLDFSAGNVYYENTCHPRWHQMLSISGTRKHVMQAHGVLSFLEDEASRGQVFPFTVFILTLAFSASSLGFQHVKQLERKS